MAKEKVDKVNEKLPFAKMVTLGLQHMLAMYAGAIAIPFVVASAVGLSPEQLAILIAADLFCCGVATLLQAAGIGNFIGIKLPVMLGCAFTSVAPFIAIAQQSGIQTAYGAVIAAGIFIFLVAPFFGKLAKFFPPVVIGSTITVIGVTLIPVGIKNAAGGAGDPTFGDPVNIFLALFVMIVILLVNKYLQGFAKTISVLIGLLVGTVVSGFMGMLDFTVVANAKWISFVKPFAFGIPKFEVGPIISMCLITFVLAIESIGVFFAAAKACDTTISEKQIVKGLRAEGVATVFGGVFNAFPDTTFTQNVGLLELTKVTSRYVAIAAGVILILLGTIPKFAALATIIPKPVFGGAMIIMFAMVALTGLKVLKTVDLEQTGNLFIVACSVGLGVGCASVEGIFAKMPEIINIVFGHGGIVVGAVTAILLNIFFNLGKKEEVGAAESHAA